MDGEKRWVWDLHPLSRCSWGNLQYPDDGTVAGQTIELRRAMGMLNGEYAVVDLLPGKARPSMKMVTFTRKFYIPTEADLAIVRTKYPDNSDPAVPPWPRIEADLITAGQSRDELVKLNAPTLLQLLASAGASIPDASPVPTSMSDRARTVGEQYTRTRDVLKPDNPNPDDSEVYDALAKACAQSDEANELPEFATWQRYLREWRKATGQQKNTRRAGRGRASGSLAPRESIEPEHLPSSIRPRSTGRSGRGADD